MPLRQALLNFYRGRVDNAKSATSMLPENRPALRRSASSSSSDSDRDTIVVAPAPCPQLPTPSESSFDVSVQDARVVTLKQVPKGRARRVSRRLTTSASHGGLVETMEHETISTRTVSGETLVNMDNTSQSTLVREGVAALDLPWNMSEVFAKEGKEAILGGRKDHMSAHMESSPGAQEDDEELRIRQAKAEAKKAKMAENNKLWEKRRKIAEKHATRRSSRVPVLDKAGQIMTSIANSVLGKRKERVEEGRDSKRSKSMGGADILPEEPSSKKRRVSQGDAPLSDEPVQQKSPLKRREKRWLSSGLYSGQPRVFDDGKNKRKSSVNFDVFKENRVLPLPMYAGERLLKQGRDFKLPFDVFSPLPAGQPKPDEWRKVNKNVFVGDAAQSWRVSKYEEHSSCMCKPETGCDQNCMNRYMYYECDERNCNLSPEQCGNRNFEGLRHRVKKGGKYNVGVEVIKTEDRGYGVRSNRTFEPHQIIVEYTGEIITQEECEHRMRTMYKNNECYYLMLFDQNMIIDATRGSIARFVNHSCDPNCRMEKWTVNGKPRMALFAGDRGIMTGEELTYDYNFDPYSQKNVQQCRCGAQKCRGVLGPRPKEERKQKSPEEDTRKGQSKLAGAKRKIVDVLEGGASRISKKVKLTHGKKKTSGRKTPSPIKVRKTTLIKESHTRKRIPAAATLAKLVASAKSKSVKPRIVSTSSAAALIVKHSPKQRAKPLGRSSSMLEKTSSVKSRVVRTVKGAQSGKSRSIRPVSDDIDEP